MSVARDQASKKLEIHKKGKNERDELVMYVWLCFCWRLTVNKQTLPSIAAVFGVFDETQQCL